MIYTPVELRLDFYTHIVYVRQQDVTIERSTKSKSFACAPPIASLNYLFKESTYGIENIVIKRYLQAANNT